MISPAYEARFAGLDRLYGAETTRRFRASHVAVVGMGGVGSWAVEALARSGIGELTLIDLDDVCLSNTNRQSHALDGQYGRQKVEAVADRVRAINPDCTVHPVSAFVTVNNVASLITDELDGVIDAIDSIKSKAGLLAHCKRLKCPVICAGGAGGQIDPTQICTADLSRTTQDPLLAKVRSLLRRDYGFSRNPKRRFGIECVYSTEQLIYPDGTGGVCHQKPGGDTPVRLDCASGFGASVAVTASFGFTACARLLLRLANSAAPTDEDEPEATPGPTL
ncbi:tRNA cyclic N6-threonylcarbamoyladenosine(37) synthase TcdA [Hydrocarboniclastica marina]|uniref:tRNA threonylcarbamoyladenosine dehydratase n=1 Tax=Hydrocarboniclastica marina TaxID=2259620 RepID=A0A4P7XLD1_9ALTE|nr:tRNA cyclic N6-threonylcarbamoyladenosine(37) synthase TcdA [Hydrocarboniclastica marina]QCF27344.1 tRNA cyclic N6-threonylcarbamoyladenosine(37) synthase TcdA [Hydrocarboniclastica marina]